MSPNSVSGGRTHLARRRMDFKLRACSCVLACTLPLPSPLRLAKGWHGADGGPNIASCSAVSREVHPHIEPEPPPGLALRPPMRPPSHSSYASLSLFRVRRGNRWVVEVLAVVASCPLSTHSLPSKLSRPHVKGARRRREDRPPRGYVTRQSTTGKCHYQWAPRRASRSPRAK